MRLILCALDGKWGVRHEMTEISVSRQHDSGDSQGAWLPEVVPLLRCGRARGFFWQRWWVDPSRPPLLDSHRGEAFSEATRGCDLWPPGQLWYPGAVRSSHHQPHAATWSLTARACGPDATCGGGCHVRRCG